MNTGGNQRIALRISNNALCCELVNGINSLKDGNTMYIFAANGITIGEITHNEKNETVVRAFRHALVDALPNDDRSYSNVILHDLTNIVNIPQDCPNYAERLNFAIYHIQSVYALANALGRSEARMDKVISG